LLFQNFAGMRKYFLIFAACFVTAIAQAQPVSKAVPFYIKAQQLQQQGMFLEAVTAFKKAILADKKYDSSHLALASLYLRISQNDSAVLVLKNAVKNKPAFAAAHEMLGMAYRDYIKNSKEAMVHYANTVKYDSSNKAAWYALAWCSNDLKQYNDAIGYAIKALDIDNRYRPAYNELGHAYRRLEAYKEAIATFKKRIDVSVSDQPLYYSGLCYIELKDKEGAQRMYEELVKLQSKSAEALKKRIDTLQ
jgi:tetratricopeptide (TPR) repeat protein